MAKTYKIVVYKVKPDSIAEATQHSNGMNCNTEWFESSVIGVEKREQYYIVTVKSTFDYPYITNKWEQWIYKDMYERK